MPKSFRSMERTTAKVFSWRSELGVEESPAEVEAPKPVPKHRTSVTRKLRNVFQKLFGRKPEPKPLPQINYFSWKSAVPHPHHPLVEHENHELSRGLSTFTHNEEITKEWHGEGDPPEGVHAPAMLELPGSPDEAPYVPPFYHRYVVPLGHILHGVFEMVFRVLFGLTKMLFELATSPVVWGLAAATFCAAASSSAGNILGSLFR